MTNPIIEEQARIAESYLNNPQARKILERIEERHTLDEVYRRWEQEYQ